jgi:hypothetical protein
MPIYEGLFWEKTTQCYQEIDLKLQTQTLSSNFQHVTKIYQDF